ncbi:MAG: FTR1 family protein [Gemmatimonadota bacterium]|nr:MAG: FTR1 family protein [Gemmatimonadota bacterium]
MPFHISVRLLTPSLMVGLLAAPAAAQQDEVATARRIADVASIALAEYAEGVADGEVVSAEELNEARLFLADALSTAEDLGPRARSAALPYLQRLQAGVDALAPEAGLQVELAGLRRDLAAAVGAPLDPMPTAAPSLARGERLYGEYCASCHGDAGGGDGVLAASLEPPPADLADADALRSVPPVEFFRKINVGVAGTAMPGFTEQLDADERWAVALYAATLRYPPDVRAAGAGELERRCVDCAAFVSDFHQTALMSDDSLATLLAARTGGGLDDAELAPMVAYARAAGAAEQLGGDRRLAAVRTAARTRAVLEEAVLAANASDYPGAARRALDAYLVFEGIESGVKARDAAAARRVEQAFADFRGAIAREASASEMAASRDRVEAALDAALDIITAQASPGLLFGQSLVIMLREGLEAILIIGALVAFLTKAGATDRKRDMGLGVLAALGASLLTAVGFATLFRNAAAQQEVLEGVTMLVAAAVLFWVSYWLVSKIELRKWQQFVGSQMRKALGSKRAWALAAVAFLAVYREGFETVLFYAALFTTSDGTAAATGGIVGGILVGAVLLAVVYYAIERYGVRLPLRPFFVATSALLYVMAFSFAGKGVSELQEAGVISITPLEWLPSLPALGVFPTYQTFLTQLFVAAALAGALVWVFWLEPLRAKAAVRAA